MPKCTICETRKANYGASLPNGEKSKATHCGTCNKVHGLGLINLYAKLCSYDLGDGNICSKIKKGVVNDQPLCGEHLKVTEGTIQRSDRCKEDGCSKVRTAKGYCRTHARIHGIKQTDDCVDCKLPKRGTYKDDKSYYCKACYTKRFPDSETKRSHNINRKCEGVDCDKRPTYAPSAREPALRCKKCCEGFDWININDRYVKPKTLRAPRPPKMDPRVHHICIANGCTRSRSYGYTSDHKRLVCLDHIQTLEVRENDPVTNLIGVRKCECGRVAKYGADGATTHCSNCKSNNMNKLTRTCEVHACDNDPRWGLRNQHTGKVKAVRCEEHCEKGDARGNRQLCQSNDNGLFTCDARGHFKSNDGEIFCFEHVKNAKVVGLYRPQCKHSDCGARPSYGTPNQSPTHCVKHKSNEMVNLCIKLCEYCESTFQHRIYKPHCSRCYFFLNPEDPRISNFKTKEQSFMIPLKRDHYPAIVIDKRITGGCSRRRPDGFIECLTHSVVVEIDENQHAGYDDLCENKRMCELYLDTGSRPIVFIRMNPDAYRCDGKKVESVFKKTKTGELKSNSKELARRLGRLKAAIDQAIAIVPTKAITVIQLCFTTINAIE